MDNFSPGTQVRHKQGLYGDDGAMPIREFKGGDGTHASTGVKLGGDKSRCAVDSGGSGGAWPGGDMAVEAQRF